MKKVGKIMNNNIINVQLNQIMQSIKIECKRDNPINIPNFFSNIEIKNNISNRKIPDKKNRNKDYKKNDIVSKTTK